MEEKNLSTESLPDSYRTGEVQPPKNYRGIITFLLLLVIFLGSLVSALGFANIHLFRLLQNTDKAPVRFVSDMRFAEMVEQTGNIELSGLGLQGHFLTVFDQHYFDLPQGIYITEISDSFTEIYTGDILTGINGNPVTDPDTVNALLESYAPGEILHLDIIRDGHHQIVNASLK